LSHRSFQLLLGRLKAGETRKGSGCEFQFLLGRLKTF